MPGGPAAGTWQVHHCTGGALALSLRTSVLRWIFHHCPAPWPEQPAPSPECHPNSSLTPWPGLFRVLDHPGQVGAPCPRAGVGIHGTSMGMKRFLPPSIGSGGRVQRQRHPLLWGEQGEQSTLSPAASKQPMATRALGAAAEGGQGRAPNQARKSSLEGKKGKTHKAERQSAVRESYQEILKHKARASPEGMYTECMKISAPPLTKSILQRLSLSASCLRLPSPVAVGRGLRAGLQAASH